MPVMILVGTILGPRLCLNCIRASEMLGYTTQNTGTFIIDPHQSRVELQDDTVAVAEPPGMHPEPLDAGVRQMHQCVEKSNSRNAIQLQKVSGDNHAVVHGASFGRTKSKVLNQNMAIKRMKSVEEHLGIEILHVCHWTARK